MRGRPPTLVPRDERERRVIDVWRQCGLTDGSMAVYLCSVRRFRAHWRVLGVDEIERLTHADVMGYARGYVGPRLGRRVKDWNRQSVRSAMHAWSCALQSLGVAVPPWRSQPVPRRWPALVKAYGEYRRSQRGVAVRTLPRDTAVASGFLRSLRSRSVATIGVKDKDPSDALPW